MSLISSLFIILKNYRRLLSEYYKLTGASVEEFAHHINECYTEEGVTVDELTSYKERDVYDEDVWIAVRDRESDRIVASGIGEYDSLVGEGILDWIQVSPEYRNKGLGRVIVSELLARLSTKADFVTVSGRVNNSGNPFELYKSCGFVHPVIWHVVTRQS